MSILILWSGLEPTFGPFSRKFFIILFRRITTTNYAELPENASTIICLRNTSIKTFQLNDCIFFEYIVFFKFHYQKALDKASNGDYTINVSFFQQLVLIQRNWKGEGTYEEKTNSQCT